MSEKFCLKWNDYQFNWNRSLSELRNDNDFADVTLISDDKVKFSAHKVLLSSCSNMFKFILKSSKHTNPFLFLGGVSSVNLGFILDYIYHGEVKIFQEQLDSFLEIAQKLEIEGLLGNSKVSQENIKTCQETYENKIEPLREEGTQPTEKQIVKMSDNSVNTRREYSRTPSSDVASLNTQEIKNKMKELYKKIDGVWKCMACDYNTANSSGTMLRHVETHMDGLSYTCNICSKEFRLRDTFYKHIRSASHKQ